MNWKNYFEEKDERKRWDILQKTNRLSYDHVDTWLKSLKYYLDIKYTKELQDSKEELKLWKDKYHHAQKTFCESSDKLRKEYVEDINKLQEQLKEARYYDVRYAREKEDNAVSKVKEENDKLLKQYFQDGMNVGEAKSKAEYESQIKELSQELMDSVQETREAKAKFETIRPKISTKLLNDFGIQDTALEGLTAFNLIDFAKFGQYNKTKLFMATQFRNVGVSGVSGVNDENKTIENSQNTLITPSTPKTPPFPEGVGQNSYEELKSQYESEGLL